MAAVESRMRFGSNNGISGGLPENEGTWQDCQLSRIDERLEGMASASLVDSSPTHYSSCSYPVRQPPATYFWPQHHSHSTPALPSQPEIHQLGSDNSNVPYVTDVPVTNRDMYGNPYYTPGWDPNLNIAEHPSLINGYNNNNNSNQNEEQEQNSVISAIRSEMAKLREQMVVRRDTKNALSLILSEREQEIEHLKGELENSRSQHQVVKEETPGPITIQLNINNPVSNDNPNNRVEKEGEEQDVDTQKMSVTFDKKQGGDDLQQNVDVDADADANKNRGECRDQQNAGAPTLAATSAYQTVSENSHLRSSHVDESFSQHSGTNPNNDVETQVLSLMRELDNRVVESAQAKQEARILQRHFEKMSDKVMMLNTQVFQLHTMLALQQDQNQDTLQNLHTVTQELTQRDAELEDVAYLVCQIGRQVGINLPSDAQNLQQICVSLDTLSSMLSTWTPYTPPTQTPAYPPPSTPPQKFQPCPYPYPSPLPNLKLPPTTNNQLQGLKTMLVLNSLLYGVHVKACMDIQNKQCMDIQDKQRMDIQDKQCMDIKSYKQYTKKQVWEQNEDEDEGVQKKWFSLGDSSFLKCMGNQSKEGDEEDVKGKKMRAVKNQRDDDGAEELRQYNVDRGINLCGSASVPPFGLESLNKRIKGFRKAESENQAIHCNPTKAVYNISQTNKNLDKAGSSQPLKEQRPSNTSSQQNLTKTEKRSTVEKSSRSGKEEQRKEKEEEEKEVEKKQNNNNQRQEQQSSKNRSYFARLGSSLAAVPKFIRSVNCVQQGSSNSPQPVEFVPSSLQRINSV